jgi:nucleoside-diphosphate-sugar epimerase
MSRAFSTLKQVVRDNMAKIIVTGGAGFIGSHLVDKLIERNHEVSVIDNLSTGKREYINPKANFFELDISSFETIKSIFKNIDFVFHLAAIPRIPLSIKKPLQTNEVNITGTLNILMASKEAGVKKVIYTSSSSAYGQQSELPMREDMTACPLNPYALQKYVGELYCKIFSEIYKLPTVSLRYFNVYGSRQPEQGTYAPVMGIFLRQKAEGRPLTVTGDGEQTRDFTHVSDVVEANILAMESEKADKGEVINVGAGENHSVNEIARMVGGEITYIPLPAGEMRDTLADISKARELLGWEPKVNLEQGINNLLNNAK